MTNYDEYFQLDLLVPWDLPTNEQVNETDKVKLSQALSQILKALEMVDTNAGLLIIQNVLDELEPPDVLPVKASSTKTALKIWEIKDFDNHFDVNHVESAKPALCIVRSLMLGVYRMFILLDKQNHDFNSVELQQQKQGYISYIRLLSRVYNFRLDESK
ncbi:MAG: hypothetical protein AAF208_12895 [Cyanobacteria bacterium P01_A01_bin.45]